MAGTLGAMASPNVPDKPSLDGLEARGAPRGRPTGTYRFDRTADREPRCSPSTRRRPPCRGSLHVGHVFSYTHTDTDRPLPAHARQGGLLPDGLGRQRPAHRAPGAELLRRALRPVAALRRRLHAARRSPAQEAPGLADQPAATSSSCASELDRRGREGLRGRCGAASASRSTGRCTYTTIGDAARSASASGRSCATSPAARPTSPRRRRCGTSPSRPRWPRPSSRTASARAPTTGSPSTAPTAASRSSSSRPPGPSCSPLRRPRRPPRRRALPAAVRHHGHHAGVRRRGPGARPPAGRARQGHRHRHDLHLRRPHRRHLVARAATCPTARRHRPRRPAPARDPRVARPTTRGRGATRELAGKTPSAAQRARWSSCSRESGDLIGEPEPITHPVKFYEKGDKPLEIVTTRQWYIRNGGRDDELRDALLGPRRRARLAPRLHAPPLRQLGRAASTATG